MTQIYIYFYFENECMKMYNSVTNDIDNKSKVGELSWEQPKGSLFNSYYTEV